METLKPILFYSITCLVLYAMFIVTTKWFNYERQINQEKPYRIVLVLMVLAIVYIALIICWNYLEILFFGDEVIGGLAIIKLVFKCILFLIILMTTKIIFKKKDNTTFENKE